MVTVIDSVIFCQDCGQPVRVPPGSRARRRYCPACELARKRAGGLRGHEGGQFGNQGGRGHKKPQPVIASEAKG